MIIQYCSSYKELSEKASNLVLGFIKNKNNLVIALAAGNSPIGLYENLSLKIDDKIASQIKCIQLDEYIGASVDDKESFAFFIKEHFTSKNKINHRNVLSFNGAAKDSKKECERYSEALNKLGAIDITILGLGVNGHIAFNEPSSTLNDTTRVVKLSETSIDKNKKYHSAMTIGIKEIMSSGLIVLLITGLNKKEIFKRFIQEVPNKNLPATFVKLHSNLIVFVDQNLLKV